MGSATSFTKHDLEMIEISWAFLKNKDELGLNTMVKLFNKSAEIKILFNFATRLELIDDMMDNGMIRYHASLVINTLDRIVMMMTQSSICNKDKKQLIELGKRHYHYGLRVEHFQVKRSHFFSHFFSNSTLFYSIVLFCINS
jgi:hypothetical protein